MLREAKFLLAGVSVRPLPVRLWIALSTGKKQNGVPEIIRDGLHLTDVVVVPHTDYADVKEVAKKN